MRQSAWICVIAVCILGFRRQSPAMPGLRPAATACSRRCLNAGSGGPQRILRDMPQPAAEDSISGTRHQRPRSSRCGYRGVGNGGPKTAHRNDASQIHAASGSRDAGQRCIMARNRTRSRSGTPSESWRPGAAADESNGICQCRPRSAGPAGGCQQAVAERQHGFRIRQHCRRSGNVAIADSILCFRRDEDQPPCSRRSFRASRACGVQRRPGLVSEHAHGWLASRHPGRNDRASQLPSRCGVSDSDRRRTRRHDDRWNACSHRRTRPNTNTRRVRTRLAWRTFPV